MACKYQYKNEWFTKEALVKKLSTENTSYQTLYNNLLKELEYGTGKEVFERVKRDYQYKIIDKNNTDISEIKDETELPDNLILDGKEYYYDYNEGLYNGVSAKFIFNKLKKANNSIKYTLEEQQEEALVELLGMYTANKLDAIKDKNLISLLKQLLKEMTAYLRSLFNSKEIEIEKLSSSMTLDDLANLLAYTNSKIILPEAEVIYTTPDNKKFKTYAEASKHISNLAKNVEDVDLDSINLENIKNIPDIFTLYSKPGDEDPYIEYLKYYKKDNKWFKEYGIDEQIVEVNEISEKQFLSAFFTKNPLFENNTQTIHQFIEKNKEYEQSKEIIEEWKRVNNIQYNPEEIYSRGQEFSSVVGAYSSFDVNLMMQNLLAHIEDNEKAGGKFAISVFTKPVDKTIGHLEGGGGKIKFKIFPKSEDILWAANRDVYSGSVWDAGEKVNKDKKSELLGVSYTKYPSLENVKSVQPNLADIIDDIQWSHNELGISLNFSNFELEFDEDVPYETKKIINSINKILKEKRGGELSKPKINTKYEDRYKNRGIIIQMNEAGDIIEFHVDSEETRYSYQNNKYYAEPIFFGKFGNPDEELEITKKEYEDAIKKYLPYTYKDVVQPKITNETLKESIDSVQKRTVKLIDRGFGEMTGLYQPEIIDISDGGKNERYLNSPFKLTYEDSEGKLQIELFKTLKEAENRKKEILKTIYKNEKDYNSQALINTKIAALKEVAKKYPRSLIRSEVKVRDNYTDKINYQQLSSSQTNKSILTDLNNTFEDNVSCFI